MNAFRARFKNEQGIALPAVIILAVIMMTLVGATAGFAINSLDTSRHDQDWNSALSAAEAGLDDYLYRLNRDSEYWLYNSTNLPSDGNVAFNQWVNVPGTSNGQFRYYVNTDQLNSEGIIRIVSSGKVRETVRTVEALLRRRNFLDYLYFTEYETTDPAMYTGYPFSAAQAQAACAHHYYDSVGRHENCSNITFFSQDVIKGPLHSNDAILISGTPTFQDSTTTSWDGTCQNAECTPSSNRYRGSGNPNFADPGDPAYAPPLTLPPSNSEVKEKADATLGGEGCLFTGPTRITLNSNGTMNVTSPQTVSSNCQTGNGRPLPSNGVIYVQNQPSSGPNAGTCSSHPLSYPVSGDINTAQYGCGNGDVFVSGVLNGQLTIAAEDSVIITGNTTYAGGTTGDDLLGLVANNYVEIYHPVSCSNWYYGYCTSASNLSGSLTNPTVHAAILTVDHSFRVQNYSYGSSLGTLSVFGTIGQLYRGAVGTFSGGSTTTGYSKDYTYDTKLRFTSPPHFLDPVASAWGIKTWAECKPFSAPGTSGQTSCS
jgi:hypothetical protein